MFCVSRPFIPDRYDFIVNSTNKRLFNDNVESEVLVSFSSSPLCTSTPADSSVISKVRELAQRFLTVAHIRTRLVKKYLLPPDGALLSTIECPGRLVLYHDWHRTDDLVEADEARMAASRGVHPSRCICNGQCEAARRQIFDDLFYDLDGCLEVFEFEYLLT